MLWSERVSDHSFTSDLYISTPLTRNIFSICVSHHRWHSLISCILSVLYVWITVMTKKNQSFLILSDHNFNFFSSPLSFIVQTNYHQSWGIDNFTLLLSSFPFFFSFRSHSIRHVLFARKQISQKKICPNTIEYHDPSDFMQWNFVTI